jgi:hypothetical protein
MLWRASGWTRITKRKAETGPRLRDRESGNFTEGNKGNKGNASKHGGISNLGLGHLKKRRGTGFLILLIKIKQSFFS